MKLSVENYRGIIKDLKLHAHENKKLYIEIIANDLMLENEPTGKNVRSVTTALALELLEGDMILNSCKGRKDFTVRYYCDNLSNNRKTYYEVLTK